MHKHFKWAIVVQKEGVEYRLGTNKLKKKYPHVCKSEHGVVLKFSLKFSIFAMSRKFKWTCFYTSLFFFQHT